MHNKIIAIAALSSLAWSAQGADDPAFKSVGRDAPLAVNPHVSTPAMPAQPTPEQLADYIKQTQARTVGPLRTRLRPFGSPQTPDNPVIEVGSAWKGEVPKGVKPLPVDLFTSKDFYQDEASVEGPALLPLQQSGGHRGAARHHRSPAGDQ